jgi:hypothetical protein
VERGGSIEVDHINQKVQGIFIHSSLRWG